MQYEHPAAVNLEDVHFTQLKPSIRNLSRQEAWSGRGAQDNALTSKAE